MITVRPAWLIVAVVCASSGSALFAQSSFVNWENPHVHPLDMTPDGAWLCAVNTPDGRLEVFDTSAGGFVHAFDVPVGVDPVSVRARTDTEVWVVNHISDSVSIVDLTTRRVIGTLSTDDEPADVVFAGRSQRAYVSCSQANTVLVFDPADRTAPPARIAIDGEDPRAMAVSKDGRHVFVAVFESGNSSTVLAGGFQGGVVAFPPNVVNHPTGPYGGQNPPPNRGMGFEPPLDPNNPAPPAVSLIVKQQASGQWLDDNAADWSSFVSGADASLSGRPTGWGLPDHDVAVIDTADLSMKYVRHLMNVCMAIAVNPETGEVTVVGTDATNEIRFEPNVRGKFLRVVLARIGSMSALDAATADLNPHLDYQTATVPQSERDKSLGDPRGIIWASHGKRGYVSGMGSNSVVVVDGAGKRAGIAPSIQVGEGPTGLALDEAHGRLFVLDKFESAISIVSLASELEIARVAFHDPSPQSIKLGRKHLYDTHKTSGLGQIACASCHVDGRTDRLAWDLGDPAGPMKALTGQNLGANIPGLNAGFAPWHPMKGPMATQTLQDIIGKEPLHWRGDRAGLEEFNGAFVGLQGDDVQLTPAEMQEYENFLATITIPPNPFRNFDNTLPTDLPLPGHHTIGRFAPAGQPLPNGNAVRGLALYRPPNRLDMGAFACSTCHTLPVGMDTDFRRQGAQFVPIATGPLGERHHALVSADGSTNVTIKIPQLRTAYEKVGCDFTQTSNRSGIGFVHDGSVDSIERFVAEPVFNVTSDQDVADLVAFMLAFSGSDLPTGSTTAALIEPPGPSSKDTHAAVGQQTTLVSAQAAPPRQLARIASMIALADSNKVGLVVKGVQAGLMRGYAYIGGGVFQSDRAAETRTALELEQAAALASELTYTVVPEGSETRIGVDRDLDGVFDRDELDQGTDPADAASNLTGCAQAVPSMPRGLQAATLRAGRVQLSWTDASSNETGFVLERADAGSSKFDLIAHVPADATDFPDLTVAAGGAYVYRLRAYNCAGYSGVAIAHAVAEPYLRGE